MGNTFDIRFRSEKDSHHTGARHLRRQVHGLGADFDQPHRCVKQTPSLIIFFRNLLSIWLSWLVILHLLQSFTASSSGSSSFRLMNFERSIQL